MPIDRRRKPRPAFRLWHGTVWTTWISIVPWQMARTALRHDGKRTE